VIPVGVAIVHCGAPREIVIVKSRVLSYYECRLCALPGMIVHGGRYFMYVGPLVGVEIIISDALNSLLNGNVRVSAKIDILRFSETY